MAFSQITEIADLGLLFSHNFSCKDKFEAIKEKLVQQFFDYPEVVKKITSKLQVIHISRDPCNNLKFECRLIEWELGQGWCGKDMAMPIESDILFVLGSGAGEFKANYDRYRYESGHGTSRSVFHCFCDTLFNIKDKKCGGAPQLVGIYRKPNSQALAFGVIQDKQKCFLGAQVNKHVYFANVEWRNDLFERCDELSMKRLEHAQAQPDILRRSKVLR